MPEVVKSASGMLKASEIRALIAKAQEPLKMILLLLSTTGLRINEALGLSLADLDFEQNVIHVRHSAYNGTLGTPKSEASKADVPMPEVLAAELQAYIASPDYRKNPKELLFANSRMRPYSDDKLRLVHLTPLLKSLNINRPGVKFHAIRHAVASEMMDAGTPITVVRDQLRHSDVRVTLEIYGHVIGNAQKRAANKLAKKFRTVA
jgi:integrase